MFSKLWKIFFQGSEKKTEGWGKSSKVRKDFFQRLEMMKVETHNNGFDGSACFFEAKTTGMSA